MERDASACAARGPSCFSNLRTGKGVDTIVRFIEEKADWGAG